MDPLSKSVRRSPASPLRHRPAGAKYGIPASEGRSHARLAALSSLFLAAAVISGCGGAEPGSTSPSNGANPPSQQQPTNPGGGIGHNDPNPPEQEPPQTPTTPNLPSGNAPAAPAPTPAQQLPSGVDMSNPGAPITVTTAAVKASTSQGGNTAAKAVDGNGTTRWESGATDDQYIQFDLGSKTQLGSMKLVWENAYGKEYAIQVSDDETTWYQLRYVAAGKGGTEEFYNLNAYVRYVRIVGVKRATQYGYSLFEVSFKTPGSDNTLGSTVATSFIPHPDSGAGLVAPPASAAPIETVQFSLPDGTLVTRFGFVGRPRHARERGEDWNEIGYGPNETVDAFGKPLDKGSGPYLNFVANYFKNRTWGTEFIDNSKVAGVTKPTIVVNQYFQQDQRGGGHSFFRGFDNPNTTGFGWRSPGDLLDDTTYTDGFRDLTSCRIVPKPPQNALRTPGPGYDKVFGANDGCSVVLSTVPGYKTLQTDANGVMVPTGTEVPARPIKAGDAIEFTGSFFASRASMDAVGDNGAFRYYTNELTYVVGEGLRPWYGVQPRLNNAVLPASTLSGGIGSVSYDYSDNPTAMFQQPHNHIGMQNMQRFVEGRRWFHTNMATGDHNENGNDRNTRAVGLQGPMFNQQTCFGCHINNGRSLAPSVVNQRIDTMAVRTAQTDGSGKQLPHPMYGQAAQMNAKASTDTVKRDWGTGVRVAGFETRPYTLGDGTVVELSKPKIAFDGPTPDAFSVRSAQPVIGMGLLAAIPDADIIARARSTPDGDGVKGVANFAYDPETGAVKLGRYGWKASKVSLRHQSAAAALLDMSVTSPVYPSRDCMYGPDKCKTRVDPGLQNDELTLLERYVALLAVPAQRSLVSGWPKGVAPIASLDVDPNKIAAGAKLFTDIKCSSCHITEMKTGNTYEFAEVRNQTIRPYTDMLLHDMGPDLADNLTEGLATGSMWRTSALWGIGYTEIVAGKGIKVGYLHDSRARNLTEAILWHGGEGTAARNRFAGLSKTDREALLAFLGSL